MKNIFCQTAAQRGRGGSTAKKDGPVTFLPNHGTDEFYFGDPGRVMALGQERPLYAGRIFEPAIGSDVAKNACVRKKRYGKQMVPPRASYGPFRGNQLMVGSSEVGGWRWESVLSPYCCGLSSGAAFSPGPCW